jgi:hypothetical protein
VKSRCFAVIFLVGFVRLSRRCILILFYKRKLCKAKSKLGSMRNLRTLRRFLSLLKVFLQLAEEARIESILSVNYNKVKYYYFLVN